MSRKIWDDIVDPVLGEACFTEWARLGTLEAAAKSIESKGFRNSKRNPLQVSVIRTTAYRWMAFHPDEARTILEQVAGKTHTDESWKHFWVTKSLMGVGRVDSELRLWLDDFDVTFTPRKRPVITE